MPVKQARHSIALAKPAITGTGRWTILRLVPDTFASVPKKILESNILSTKDITFPCLPFFSSQDMAPDHIIDKHIISDF